MRLSLKHLIIIGSISEDLYNNPAAMLKIRAFSVLRHITLGQPEVGGVSKRRFRSQPARKKTMRRPWRNYWRLCDFLALHGIPTKCPGNRTCHQIMDALSQRHTEGANGLNYIEGAAEDAENDLPMRLCECCRKAQLV